MFRKINITAYVFLLFFLFPCFAYAHTYRVSAIVDTDMALDDIRAVVMLLNSDMFDIPLMVTSDGATSPRAGARNLRMLLRYFKREGTEIAEGRLLGKAAPPWRVLSEDIKWPEPVKLPDNIPVSPRGAAEIVKILESQDQAILYLCLGPLTNLADALRLNPGIKNKISRLIYYGSPPEAALPDWNTSRDLNAARIVFGSGLRIYYMSLLKEKLICFDYGLYRQIESMDTAAARLVTSIHSTPDVQRLLSEKHFWVWDEMTVIYLNTPSLFKFVPSADNAYAMSLSAFKAAGVHNTYLKLLGHAADFHLSPRNGVVLKVFPDDPSLFREDVSAHVKKIIDKYGLEEWKACLLTNEFHRHLGIYSLIGAKMGVRAREILEAPFDTLKVVSFAGNDPPLSCMNDGLQVATGASLGRGAIQISDKNPCPAAAFQFRNKKVTLRVKSLWVDKIKEDIKSALKKYGGLNPEYFAHIRELSILYWQDLNRGDIFDERLE
jgi:pyrimidine-specific ribonucleoside hydrolase